MVAGDATGDDGGTGDVTSNAARGDAGRVNDANGHRYLVVRASAPISWTEARVAAEALGGHLATVTSSSENDFIFSLVSRDRTAWGPTGTRGPWLGGVRPSKGAAWTWITGEPFTYESWFAGEPNNVGDANAYLAFFDPNRLTPGWGDEGLSGYDDVVSFIVEFDQG